LLSAKIKIIYQYNFDTSSQEIAFFFEIWTKITMIWQLYRILAEKCHLGNWWPEQHSMTSICFIDPGNP
jgi:hypothetical protein